MQSSTARPAWLGQKNACKQRMQASCNTAQVCCTALAPLLLLSMTIHFCTELLSLAYRVILPGNPGICGSVPGTLMAAQLMQNGTTLLEASDFSATCPTASNVNGPISVEAQANTSSNVLVALVPWYAALPCAALPCPVLGLCFWLWHRWALNLGLHLDASVVVNFDMPISGLSSCVWTSHSAAGHWCLCSIPCCCCCTMYDAAGQVWSAAGAAPRLSSHMDTDKECAGAVCLNTDKK